MRNRPLRMPGRMDPRACGCQGVARCVCCMPLFTTPEYIRDEWIWERDEPVRALDDSDYEYDTLANYPNYDHL